MRQDSRQLPPVARQARSLPPAAQDVRYGGEPALVVAGHAIVGVGADAKPGPRQLVIDTAAGQEIIVFEVRGRPFPEQRLTIDNPRLVNPEPADLARYRRERAEQDAAYALYKPVRSGLVPVEWPVAGPISSQFGLRRFLNGQPRARHSGLDIAAEPGTPVRAPAPAAVAAVGGYFFNGNTVLLDHGGGPVTMYCHLQRIATPPLRCRIGGRSLDGAVVHAAPVRGRGYWVRPRRLRSKLSMCGLASTASSA